MTRARGNSGGCLQKEELADGGGARDEDTSQCQRRGLDAQSVVPMRPEVGAGWETEGDQCVKLLQHEVFSF